MSVPAESNVIAFATRLPAAAGFVEPVEVPAPARCSTARVRRLPVVVGAVLGHRAVRASVRQPVYVVVGAVSARGRLRDARTTARHERMMRAAEAAGDHTAALEWEARAATHRAARHTRRMDLIAHGPLNAARSLAITVGALVAVLLALGLILGSSSGRKGDVVRPLLDALAVVRGVVAFVEVAFVPVLVAVPVVLLTWFWTLGRTRANVPVWLAPAGVVDEAGAPVTPSAVVVALRDLGIPELRRAIRAMGDAGAGMLGPIRLAGCGVEVDVTLPSGVTTAEISARRRKLAENLSRHEHEVFVTIPAAARTVRLWIADSGALDEPIGPSPLVIDPTATADYYTGRAPWGQDLRGDAARISLFQRHLLITGLSNQGKTASLRALALWAVLDPTIELRIADLKGVGDWRMFAGLATTLIQGPSDEHVMAAVEMAETAVEEMERRLVALERSGATDGVTRDMARAPGSGFHPIILIVDEAQVAFMCPAAGPDRRPLGGTKATSRYFMACRKIHNQGRAVNVTLWQGTQDPTDQNLPKLVREGAHIRASLVVGTEAQARMALGDKAVNAGAAPHKLRQGLDKGTVVVAGDGVELGPGQHSITIRTHFVSGVDAADIAEAARARRAAETSQAEAQGAPALDVLADVADVLGGGETLVKTVEVLHRLAALDPAYATWSQRQLSQALAPAGVVARKTRDGSMHLDRRDVLAALDEPADHDPHGEPE